MPRAEVVFECIALKNDCTLKPYLSIYLRIYKVFFAKTMTILIVMIPNQYSASFSDYHVNRLYIQVFALSVSISRGGLSSCMLSCPCAS